jgi:hypothetical protein
MNLSSAQNLKAPSLLTDVDAKVTPTGADLMAFLIIESKLSLDAINNSSVESKP